jgi:myo-inositol-1(or 4)-monophosphatase
MAPASDADLAEFAQFGVDVVREAGSLLLSRYGTRFGVARKGVVDLVTEVDFAAEKLIVSRIKQRFPGHHVLAEEEHSESARRECTWIIDPIDGTVNYARGFPFFAVSIGFEIAGELAWGAVFDPLREEMFTALSGRGAACNGVPIRVSSTARLSESLLTTGFPYDIRTSAENNLDNFNAFMVHSLGVRRPGAAALDLSYVAAGRFDGYWELKLKPWDCAAGYLLVREAGGVVTDFSGARGLIDAGQCVATNGWIHREMLDVLKQVARATPGPA